MCFEDLYLENEYSFDNHLFRVSEAVTASLKMMKGPGRRDLLGYCQQTEAKIELVNSLSK